MVAPELISVRRQVGIAAVVVGTLSALGAAVAMTWPQLGGSIAPHAALQGGVSDALAILANNLRALTAPFVLGMLGLARTRTGRRVGDLVVLGVAAANAIPVGLALGRWQARLLPYVPQLPLEWAGLATAGAGWLHARTGIISTRQLTVLAGVTVILLAGAATVETWCTPHRRSTNDPGAARTQSDVICDLTACGVSGGLTVATDGAPAAAGSLQGRALPSPRCVRFRSAATPALTGLTSTHRPPQGGIT
jgi:hypothetical protein